MIDRDQSDMVNENALHITHEQAAVFAVKREVMKAEEAEALRQKAAESDWLREQLERAQSGALAIQSDGGLIVQGFRFTPTGLIAPEIQSPDAWVNIGRLIAKLEGSLQWLVGDWIVYGEDIEWGDVPALARDLGFSQQTLHDYTYVARNVQFSIRIENLSFAHHRLVAKYPPEQQSYALRGAAHFGFSVADFRKWIKLGMPEGGLPQELPGGRAPASQQEAVDDPVVLTAGAYARYFHSDPAKAKPDERRQAVETYHQMAQSMEEYRRRWGIE